VDEWCVLALNVLRCVAELAGVFPSKTSTTFLVKNVHVQNPWLCEY
jgi:hypothetical protein